MQCLYRYDDKAKVSKIPLRAVSDKHLEFYGAESTVSKDTEM